MNALTSITDVQYKSHGRDAGIYGKEVGQMRKTGEILMELRKERGLGQKELAKLWNLSIATISNYENNVHAPDLKMLCKIADFYDVTTDYLLGRTYFRYPPELLKKYITTDYTAAGFINIVLSLDQNARYALIAYTNYLNYLHRTSSIQKGRFPLP